LIQPSYSFSVANEENVKKHILGGSTGLLDLDNVDELPKQIMAKGTNTYDLYQSISALFDKPVEELRLWLGMYWNRPTPYAFIPNSEEIHVSKLFHYYRVGSLFVQYKKADEELKVAKGNIIIFIKFFFHIPEGSTKSPIQYLGSFVVPENQKISSLYPEVSRILGITTEVNYHSYLESINSMPAKLENDDVFEKKFISNGAVLTLEFENEQHPEFNFQLEDSVINDKTSVEEDQNENKIWQEKLASLPKVNCNSSSVSPNSYLEWYTAKNLGFNLAIASLDDPTTPLMQCQVSSSTKINQIIAAISTQLNLQFDSEKDSIILLPDKKKKPSYYSLSEYNFSAEFYYNRTNRIIFYKLIKGINSNLIDTMQIYRLTFSPNGIIPEYKQMVVAPSMSTFEHLFKLLIDKSKEDGYDIEKVLQTRGNRIRYSQIASGKMWNFNADPNDVVRYSSYPIKIDLIPEEQRVENMKEGEMIIEVNTVTKDSYGYYKSYGSPFMFKILPNEKFAQTKERIMASIGDLVPEEKMKKSSFAIHENKIKNLKDDSILSEEIASPDYAILYIITGSAKSYSSESAVKIYN